jgi:hypothetical protein
MDEAYENSGPGHYHNEVATAPSSGPSLAERMREQSELIASQRSTVFPVPGYQSMLAVELRALSVEATGRIGDRHKKVQQESMRTLLSGCDIILAATEKFYEISTNGHKRELDEGISWQSLAVQVRGVSPELSPRACLLALLTDVNVLLLIQLWDEWMASEKQKIDEVMVEDFASTP